MLLQKARRLKQVRSAGLEPSPTPFVVGAGRSGTTLLRLMLDAHPELAIPPESYFVLEAARRCRYSSDPPGYFWRALTSHKRWPIFFVEADQLAASLAAADPFTPSEALRAFYRLYAARFDKPRWGDKTPRYVERMRGIQRLLPEARFIHLIRDGRDVALSNLDIKDLWFKVDSISDAAGWWLSRISVARKQARYLRYYLEVRYEDLVLNSEATLRTICDFIDLPWDPRMLEYYKQSPERLKERVRVLEGTIDDGVQRGEGRTDVQLLTTSPPRTERLGRWRREMSADDRRRFEAIAGDALRDLGYPVGEAAANPNAPVVV